MREIAERFTAIAGVLCIEPEVIGVGQYRGIILRVGCVQFEVKEVLINTELIWKIEVGYAERASGIDLSISTATRIADPGPVKRSRVFIGNEVFDVHAHFGGDLAQIAEKTHKQATKI